MSKKLPNPARGEVAVQLGDKTVTFVLTMEAMAQLEAVIDAPSMQDLLIRIGRPKTSELATIAEALSGGALDREAVLALKGDEIGRLVRAVQKAVALAFIVDEEADEKNVAGGKGRQSPTPTPA